jgi:hypothetical protein
VEEALRELYSNLKYDVETQHWKIGLINWDEFWQVVKGDGPCNHQRMEHHIKYHNAGAWVREAVLKYAEKIPNWDQLKEEQRQVLTRSFQRRTETFISQNTNILV